MCSIIMSALKCIHSYYLVTTKKYQFARDCLWPIVEQNFNLTKLLNYASLLELDRRVREFDFGNYEDNDVSFGEPTVSMTMQRYALKYSKEHGQYLPLTFLCCY